MFISMKKEIVERTVETWLRFNMYFSVPLATFNDKIARDFGEYELVIIFFERDLSTYRLSAIVKIDFHFINILQKIISNLINSSLINVTQDRNDLKQWIRPYATNSIRLWDKERDLNGVVVRLTPTSCRLLRMLNWNKCGFTNFWNEAVTKDFNGNINNSAYKDETRLSH